MCFNGNLYILGILTILTSHVNSNGNFFISICSIFICLHLKLIGCKNWLHIWITLVTMCMYFFFAYKHRTHATILFCGMGMFFKVACIHCVTCSGICGMLMLRLTALRLSRCIIITFYIICKFLGIPMISRKRLSLGIKFILIPCINFSRLISLCVCLLAICCNIAVCICHRNHCGSEYHQSCKCYRYDFL